jgi:hypothetical protein
VPRTAYVLVNGVRVGQEQRAVKPSAQPTLVRSQHLPLPAETARWLRKRDRRAGPGDRGAGRRFVPFPSAGPRLAALVTLPRRTLHTRHRSRMTAAARLTLQTGTAGHRGAPADSRRGQSSPPAPLLTKAALPRCADARDFSLARVPSSRRSASRLLIRAGFTPRDNIGRGLSVGSGEGIDQLDDDNPGSDPNVTSPRRLGSNSRAHMEPP